MRRRSVGVLSAIKRLLADVAGRGETVVIGEDELQLAAAALLFHVVAVDGVVSVEEREMLSSLLGRRFELDPAETQSLVKAAENADAEAVDLYGFTSVLKRTLEQSDRERIIEMMWKLVYADGSVHEFEDNAVWRVAELLAVPSQTRIRLKKSVRENAGR
jgi:uncharacterized tellurite resistance protein B-like protein